MGRNRLMQIAIFGGGKAGQHLFDEIQTHGKGEVHVKAIIDNNISDNTTNVFGGTQIGKPDEALSGGVDAVFLAAGAQKAIWQMIQTVRGYGIDDIYMMHDIAGKNKLPLFSNEGGLLSYRVRKIRFSQEKPTLPYFEMPIIDMCNLNCKGCLFGCNHSGKKSWMTLTEIRSDFIRMKELFEDIPWIRILGGEPLLHPELAEILEVAREIFPDTELDVCTNGLAFPTVSSEIMQSFKKNRISVHISGYKPTYKLIDTITNRLDQYDIEYTVLRRDRFHKFYTQNMNNDAEKSHAGCPSSGCRELYRGRLAKCSAALAFERLNEQFGTNYVVTRNRDWFDIYDKNLTGWDIIRGLDAPVPICGYCDTCRLQNFAWESGKREGLRDYILDI